MSSRIGNRWILAVALAGLSLPAATAEAAQAAEARVAQAAQPEVEAAYREAREALSRGDYERAAAMFERYRSRFPQANHLPDAYYWQAFSLYRLGSLRESLELLEAQLSAFSEAGIGRDARELELRIRALLAGQGDAAAAERASRDIASALVTGRAEQA
ncbi:MAG: outer membrane protein assembly factor BamD, partial [Gemmatimonadota bacterium]